MIDFVIEIFPSQKQQWMRVVNIFSSTECIYVVAIHLITGVGIINKY